MRGRLDLIIFLAVAGWMALKFIGAWLEQRAAGKRTEDGDAAPAGGVRERRRAVPPPPVVRRPRVNPPPLPSAADAPPRDLGELREWLREAMAQSRPGSGAGRAASGAPPPIIEPRVAVAPVVPNLRGIKNLPAVDPLVAEAEREGLDHRAAAPLGVMEEAAALPVDGAVSVRRLAPGAVLLRRGTRQRQALRQGILMAEILARPRAFDV